MDVALLKGLIDQLRFDEAIDLIEIIGEKKNGIFTTTLIEYLNKTDNTLLRNAISIALADIGSSEALVPLINQLKDPKTKGKRGTILYALESFDCSEYAEVIVESLTSRYFEESRHAYQILELIKDRMPSEVKLRCISKVNEKLEELEDEMEMLEEALDFLK
ncbi:HEAT repeat domain-containing protein [Paenibacillus sp. HB172176]|uniref:HEAT repeat domain-containing protein n=1 Tax=Paenibacillus sp. HB172176 TaxID=2493690 RepID=UPI00143B2AB1|nr:HEAT repeat domain-containing protein [Paenibacillus sp. HB172176]